MARTTHPESLSVVDDLHDVATTLEQLRENASGPDAVALDYLAGAIRRSAARVELSPIAASIHHNEGVATWQQ